MAIDGNGWFVVAQASGASTGGQQQFSTVNYYTRRGDFQLDSNGYLVNGAGYYLMGTPVNPGTGAPESSVPEVLQFNNNFLPAQSTSQIGYQANLPSIPTAGLLVPADFSVNPLSTGSGGTGTVVGNDASTFTQQSTDGGSITGYDSEGNPVNVQFRWAETNSSRRQQYLATVLPDQFERNRHPSRLAEHRDVVHVQFERAVDFTRHAQLDLVESDRERRRHRQRCAELRRGRAHAICVFDRQRAGQ